MRIRADLHIHSHFSRATSSKLQPAYLERWARIKGIGLLGTGDCTHPLWLKELRDQLDDAEEGLYTLKDAVRTAFDAGPALTEGLPEPERKPEDQPRFVLSAEISSIYKKGDKTRKIHHLILLPDFKAAAALQTWLERVGNIRSDGRPILGLDSQDLLALLLDTDSRALLIPAHIWTPWFSVLGAKSGFDSIDACYGDLASHIPAIETGLSSNPPMNWAVPSLDRFAVISNSDAHSPDKLGREGTVFNMERSFSSLTAALWAGSGAEPGIAETIEFFPQEGKYHYDGHRNCGLYLAPAGAAASGGLCPVCGRALTRGVMGRVLELAERPVDESAPWVEDGGYPKRRPYRSLIPLREILGELLKTGPASKKVDAAYNALIQNAGSELAILMDMDAGAIEALRCPGLSGELLAIALGRMRSGEVSISPGYDGEYGVIRVFPGAPGEAKAVREAGKELFEGLPASGPAPVDAPQAAGRKRDSAAAERKERHGGAKKPSPRVIGALPFGLNAAQEQAAAYDGPAALIIAGPGTGKTAALTARIARLLQAGKDPASILAITFTVKAAAELRERIAKTAAGLGLPGAGINAATFHSFCAALLREQPPVRGLAGDFRVIGEAERERLLGEILDAAPRKGRPGSRRLGEYIEARKRFLLLPGEERPQALAKEPALARLAEATGFPQMDKALDAFYGTYRSRLRAASLLDFEDLLAGTVRLLALNPPLLAEYRARFRHILVDEYQDVNFAQYALIRLLAPGGESRELRVIGDPNQAIYAFRGSDKRFIDRFLEDYPQAAVFHLTRSFRCAPPILKAAGKLTGAPLEGTENAGAMLFRSSCPTGQSEAEGIARRIAALIGGTSFFAMDSNTVSSGKAGAPEDEDRGDTDMGNCAILLRTAALAPPILKALGDHGIPFDLTGEKPWWEEEPAKAILALLGERLFPAAGEMPAGDGPALAGKSSVQAIEAAWEYLNSSRRKAKAAKGDSLNRLLALAAFYDEPRPLLDILAVSGAADQGLGIRRDGVRIMTIHASKGLEFDHVFVPALEEGILPFTLFDGALHEELIEEEKRLLYVAMTRARKGLYLSWAASRNFRGRPLKAEPSRFLKTLETIIPLAEERGFRRRDPQPDLF